MISQLCEMIKNCKIVKNCPIMSIMSLSTFRDYGHSQHDFFALGLFQPFLRSPFVHKIEKTIILNIFANQI